MLACLEHCPMAKCRRFFECEEHWFPGELAEMQPEPFQPVAAVPEPSRADWVEPELAGDQP